MPRLKTSVPAGPGITRSRRGKGWAYRTADGNLVDPVTRARVMDLVIPPAWREVWISPDANGHIQAVGSDEAGRRQYIYHDRWTAHRHQEKFGRVIDFAARLPKARSIVAGHLALPGMPRERALATAFRLLDLGHFRIGSDVYAETNGSFGLSTLRRCDATMFAARESHWSSNSWPNPGWTASNESPMTTCWMLSAP